MKIFSNIVLFAIIADYLTLHGMAVLRVDDRTMGKSTGDVKTVTTEDFAEDVMTSIAYLKTRKDIDTTAIGLIGYSEGGLIAPIVYSKWPSVKFIVLLAGPGVTGADISLQQQKDAIEKTGLSSAIVNAYLVLTKKKMDILNKDYGDDSLALEKKKKKKKKKKKRPIGATADLFALQVSTTELKPWTRFFYKTDPADYLQRGVLPLPARAQHPALRRALRRRRSWRRLPRRPGPARRRQRGRDRPAARLRAHVRGRDVRRGAGKLRLRVEHPPRVGVASRARGSPSRTLPRSRVSPIRTAAPGPSPGAPLVPAPPMFGAVSTRQTDWCKDALRQPDSGPERTLRVVGNLGNPVIVESA